MGITIVMIEDKMPGIHIDKRIATTKKILLHVYFSLQFPSEIEKLQAGAWAHSAKPRDDKQPTDRDGYDKKITKIYAKNKRRAVSYKWISPLI